MSRPSDHLNFLEFLQGSRRGELIVHASDLMEEMLAVLQERGGKGEITLKLPFKVNDAGQIECLPTVSMKKPVKAIGTGIYFVTEAGGLTRRDPSQLDMIDELDARRSRGGAIDD